MRHNQEYWLKLQADRAVEIAMEMEVKGEAEEIATATQDYGFVFGVRELILREAARLLVRAEILHRALTRMEKIKEN